MDAGSQIDQKTWTPEGEASWRDGRRMLPEKKKVFTVKAMSERHHEIARLLVLGLTNVQIADRIGCTKISVATIRNSPVVQEKMNLLKAGRDAETLDIMTKVNEALPRCVEYLAESIDDVEVAHSTKSRNAFGLLGIAGHSPVKNVKVRAVHAVLTREDIEDIKSRAEGIGSLIAEDEDQVIDI